MAFVSTVSTEGRINAGGGGRVAALLCCRAIFGLTVLAVAATGFNHAAHGQPAVGTGATSAVALQAVDNTATPATQPAGVRVESSGRPTMRPRVDFEDLVLLTRYVRRSMEDKLQGRPERPAAFRPHSLRGMTGTIRATLRSNGRAAASAQSQEMDVVDAAVAAGTLLGQAMLDKKEEVLAAGIARGLEIEWLGPREYLTIQALNEGGTWSEALFDSFEPAVHGIGVELHGRRAWTRPSEVIEGSLTPDIALAAAEKGIDLRHIQKVRTPREIRYFRFWTYHLWQPNASAMPVVLDRGAPLVLLADVTAERVHAAALRLGDYLASRRNEAGGFSHEYLPGSARFHEVNSARTQLRALSGLACFAQWANRGDLREPIAHSMRNFLAYLEPLELQVTSESGEKSREAAGQVLVPPGHGDTLEISGRLLMTILLGPPDAPGWEKRSDLIRGLLTAQEESGLLRLDVAEKQMAETALERSEEADQAGWALFALTQAYGGAEDEAIEAAVMRALPYYQRWLRDKPRPEAAAALARAFARQYEHGSDARLSDFVFDVADQLVAVQLDERKCLYPELYGALNVRKPGLIGADSALYTSVLCDAAVLARRIGDVERERRYVTAGVAAVRFLLQLQMAPPGDYYLRRPKDALWGIRNSPWDHRIRVDRCAEALEALIRARQTLFLPAS